ncbi:hypothetical protein BOTBODRAFT_97574, partial [Botryobasidium botryosum FD-172 SS1]
YTPLLLLISVFIISFLPVLAALSSLPITREFPRTLPDISRLGHELQAYADSGFAGKAHVLLVLSITAVWKHSWSVPGSVLVNVLCGTLLPPVPAILLLTVLTTIGSIFSTLLSTPLAPFVTAFFPRALDLTRNALEGSSPSSLTSSSLSSSINEKSEKEGDKKDTPVWVRLTIMRLIGIVPWSGINVACGVCGVSLWDCAMGAFIGTMPWTAVTCQVGDILQTLAASKATGAASTETLSSVLSSPGVIMKLIFLSALSLGPVLGREKLKGLIGTGSGSVSS